MFLGIDQGTTGSTAVLVNAKGKVLGKHTAPVPQHFPRPGWVEHDPEQIWKSVAASVKGALKKARVSPKKIACIGITNQRETVSLFEKSKPLHRFIVWQDRRTSDDCEALRSDESQVHETTGLPIDPYFSASKIRWLMKKLSIQQPSPHLRFRTIDSFLLERMTGADLIEATNASRTSLLNLKSGRWDPTMFDLFQIPISMAPGLAASEKLELRTKNVGFLPDGIPIEAVLGDQQAALFGQAGWEKGSGKITYGTGSFILLNIGSEALISKNHLVTTIALQNSSGELTYAFEGSAFICGAWIQWLRDQMRFFAAASDSEKLGRSSKDSGGVMVVPALSGLGAPFWKPQIRGAILGLTRGSSRAEVTRASLESLCFQNKALVEAMKKDNPDLSMNWRVDGGAVANNLLLQIQADVLQTRIIRPKNLEATSTGIALLAAKSIGELSLDEIQKLWKQDREFKPNSALRSQYDRIYVRWLKAVEALSQIPVE